MSIRITTLDHVVLNVSDEAVSADWYERVLGMKRKDFEPAPGKTRLANVYRVTLDGGAGPGQWDVYLVDLPGYGYARGGAESAAELKTVAEAYFTGRGPDPRTPSPEPRHAALLLVDARHPGLEADAAAAKWLTSLGVPYYVVATKIDKLSRSERARNLKTLERTFGTAALPVSARSGEGLEHLWTTIATLARNR